MKTSAIVSLALAAVCCPTSAAPVHIMPVGDSITRGYGSGIVMENSYRKALWHLLAENGYAVEFVGSQISGDFPGNRHEGRNGWHAAQATGTNTVLCQVAGWLAETPADIVLLHIGTNDILGQDGDAEEVAQILDEIFGANPGATVVLALIINAATNSPHRANISAYNAGLGAMAQARIANGDRLIVADMENGAGIDYASSDMADQLHPSQTGYDKMATNWYPAVAQAIALQGGGPAILSIAVDGGGVAMEFGLLAAGRQVVVERTESLLPPVWAEAGSFVAAGFSTNWSEPLDGGRSNAYYRLRTE